MGVVEAKIQTMEDIYRLVWAAVANKRPIAASYHGLPAVVLPAQAGQETRKTNCACCATSTVEKVKADFGRQARPPTGAALWWRSSEE
jgi:hypothetical protein